MTYSHTLKGLGILETIYMNKKELKKNIEWYFPSFKIQNKEVQKYLINCLKQLK